MTTSKQTPLTSPRGGSASNLTQRRVDWEAAAFDEAAYFAVVRMRASTRAEFTVFPWAVRSARQHDDACLYAVTVGGRFALLDRVKWDEWIQRWERNNGM